MATESLVPWEVYHASHKEQMSLWREEVLG